MRKACFASLLLIVCLGCAVVPLKPVQEEPVVKVILFSGVQEFTFHSSGGFYYTTSQGSPGYLDAGTLYQFVANDRGIHLKSGDRSLEMLPSMVSLRSERQGVECEISHLIVRRGNEPQWQGGRRYRGVLEIRRQSEGNLSGVLRLPMEEYLCGVVPSEIGGTAPMDAIKAQAVAARTETLSALEDRRYAGEYHDICSDVMCQVFTGTTNATSRTNQAVMETRGIAMLYQGKYIGAFYASNCGGHTEHSENAWKSRGYLPYCRGVSDAGQSFRLNLSREDHFKQWIHMMPDSYCNPNNPGIPEWAKRRFRWERRVDAEDIQKWLARRQQDIGRIESIKPLQRGVSGRLMALEFRGERGSCIVGPELEIRRVFQPMLSSAAFIIEPEGGGRYPRSFLIRGAGSGHGVGMCQVGAMGMAGRGYSYEQILRHYYAGVKLQKVY